MSRIKKLFCVTISLFLWVAGPSAIASFDMRIFKVGQANFVLLTYGTESHNGAALVVDCGGLIQDARYDTEIKSVLQNISKLGIVISHNHRDHWDGLERFNEIVSAVNSEREKLRNPPIKFTGVCYGWTKTKDDIQGYVDSLFNGTGVTVECMRPNSFKWAFLSIPSVVHENNLVLLVSYANIHILLSGDANGTILAHLLTHTENCLAKLQAVNILLAPHHGSVMNGEPVWLDAVFNSSTKIKLLFVSSDPNARHKIPNEDFRRMVGRLSSMILHPPIFFLTSEVRSICYRLSIDGGFLSLFDGDSCLIQFQYQ